jgi:hypothetical protein
MAGAGIRSFAKFRGQMLRIAATGMTFWQTLSCGLRIAKLRAQVANNACGQVRPVAIRAQL